YIGAEGDIAKIAHARVDGDIVVDPCDGLDRLMIGRHTFAHQAKWSWEAVEEIDSADQIRLLQQRVGGVKAGWTRADNRHAQRARVSSKSLCHVDYLPIVIYKVCDRLNRVYWQ